MPKKEIIISGQIIKNCTFIKEVSMLNRSGNRRALFICECGKEYITNIQMVKNGGVCKNCGYEKTRLSKIRHGQARNKNSKNTSEYSIWCAMKSRCNNPKNKAYLYYGNRGIKVCENWINSFENFLKDLGHKPSPKHTLDRTNNELGYFKENCRWATRKEQGNNKNNNRRLQFNGRAKTVPEWAEYIGIRAGTIHNRLSKKWNIEKILTTPTRKELYQKM